MNKLALILFVSLMAGAIAHGQDAGGDSSSTFNFKSKPGDFDRLLKGGDSDPNQPFLLKSSPGEAERLFGGLEAGTQNSNLLIKSSSSGCAICDLMRYGSSARSADSVATAPGDLIHPVGDAKIPPAGKDTGTH